MGDDSNDESLRMLKPIAGKFDNDEELGQYIRALANASSNATARNSNTRTKTKK